MKIPKIFIYKFFYIIIGEGVEILHDLCEMYRLWTHVEKDREFKRTRNFRRKFLPDLRR
jgi:hypothetical protein